MNNQWAVYYSGFALALIETDWEEYSTYRPNRGPQ